ncbi:uncharacterized protein PHA67_003838 isoform 2-T2 [Liasis olivaceus]
MLESVKCPLISLHLTIRQLGLEPGESGKRGQRQIAVGLVFKCLCGCEYLQLELCMYPHDFDNISWASLFCETFKKSQLPAIKTLYQDFPTRRKLLLRNGFQPVSPFLRDTNEIGKLT